MTLPTLKEKYEAALEKISALEQSLEEISIELGEIQSDIDDLEGNDTLDELGSVELDYDPEELYWFLEDIGFDPYHLPDSLGERMAIRDALASLKAVR